LSIPSLFQDRFVSPGTIFNRKLTNPGCPFRRQLTTSANREGQPIVETGLTRSRQAGDLTLPWKGTVMSDAGQRQNEWPPDCAMMKTWMGDHGCDKAGTGRGSG